MEASFEMETRRYKRPAGVGDSPTKPKRMEGRQRVTLEERTIAVILLLPVRVVYLFHR